MYEGEESFMKSVQEIDFEFDKGIRFRLADKKDIPDIMEFIKKNWKATHIFAKDKRFFEYEFVHNNEVSFCLMEDNDHIVGILGYIPYDYGTDRDMFTVMWMVLKESETFGGVGLLKFLIQNCGCHNIYSIGLNVNTRAIYQYLGYRVEKMKHYYRIADCGNYYVACIKHKDIPKVQNSHAVTFNRISKNDYDSSKADEGRYHSPYKSHRYVIHRYFDHPKYKYMIYRICREGINKDTYIVTREESYKDVKILHVVDVLGDTTLLLNTDYNFQNLIEKNKYEYISFYEFGISDKIMKSAGFIEVAEDDTNVIPNYFHPYEQTNVDIYTFFQKNVNPILFKGDGDQDRP